METANRLRLKELFAAATAMPVGDRTRFLEANCAGDPALRAELVQLLASSDAAGDFLECPAVGDTRTVLAAFLPRHPEQLEPQQRLGPYEILDQIGAGGMGRVYRARDVRLDRVVALKVLPPAAARDVEARRRFDLEARAIAKLAHPNICALYDVGSHDPTGSGQAIDFLVMEYLEGQTLAERLEAGPLPIEAAIGHAIEIADALNRAHRAGVIHRDLKPSNIILSEGRAKLLDFGIAKLLDREVEPPAEGAAAADLTLTARGRIIGTAAYMSPEQVRGEPVDARSDIFSFGAVLYELSTGRRPFTGATVDVVCDGIVKGAAAIARDASLPAGLDGIIARMLAADPAQRYQQVSDVELELRRLRSAPSAGGRRRRAPLFLAACAGLAAVAAVVYVAQSRDPRSTDTAYRGVETREPVARRQTTDSVAYEAYLKGRYFWNMRTAEGLQKALSYFEQAIDRDGKYAAAYAGLADTYAMLGSNPYAVMPASEAGTKAKAAARRALALDDSLASAHVSLAFVTYAFDWDRPAGERGLRRAIELDPNYATAHLWYALYLGQLGRVDEALAEAERCRALDPLSLIGTYAVGLAHYFGRHYDDAEGYARKALEIDPNFPGARRLLGQVYAARNDSANALAEIQRLNDASGANWLHRGLLAHAHGRAGNRAQATAILDGMVQAARTRFVPAGPIAIGYIGLDDRDAAFAWLERAYTERSEALNFLKADPLFDSLRSDPRFPDLLRRVALAP